MMYNTKVSGQISTDRNVIKKLGRFTVRAKKKNGNQNPTKSGERRNMTLVVFLLVVALGFFPMLATSPGWFTVGWAILVLGWSLTGLRKIEVGWRALVTLLGRRTAVVLEEGWQWMPFPFNTLTADCREIVVQLDPIKVVTADNVSVTIKASVVRRTTDLGLWFDLNPDSLKRGLDDLRDQVIRTQVRNLTLADLLGASNLGQTGGFDTANWGIEILRVAISEIAPDPKVMEDLSEKTREEAQRQGQIVEADLFIELVRRYIELGRLTPSDALQQVRATLGQLTTTEQSLRLDPTTVAIIANILERR